MLDPTSCSASSFAGFRMARVTQVPRITVSMDLGSIPLDPGANSRSIGVRCGRSMARMTPGVR